ncbi:unnamed protein product [Lepeophtheirus salmonis]|uniref:(salmon louse) hypothetical protein n=1 Tax=Lepeophtheirus salmonis TaxID=72036 RepID=A0A7R8CFB5_LEPSM|nr:unnamed protein product [Lepeophtheirus salmonis]CAF2805115.1 unnamed protein product [Lepeophtheirus salmonis]
MKRTFWTLILALYSLLCGIQETHGNYSSGLDLLGDFCSKNGFSSVLLYIEEKVENSDIRRIGKSLNKSNVRVRILTSKDSIQGVYTLQKVLYIHKSDYANLNDLLSIFPIDKVLVYSLHGVLPASYDNITATSLFYTYSPSGNGHKIAKLRARNFIIVNPLLIGSDGRFLEKPLDLGGIQIRSVTLNWAPYLIMKCRNGSKENCEARGYIHDLISVYEREMNFTTNYIEEKNKFWGSAMFPNQTYGGTLGALSDGTSDIQTCAWVQTYERKKLFDFFEIGLGYLSGVLFMKNKNADYEFFSRPFSNSCWVVISSIVGFSILFAIGLSIRVEDSMETYCFITLVTSLAYFFVLLNAYYGGAMTMFFTTEVTVPFETMEDVMRNPDWSVIFTDGEGISLRSRLPKGNKGVDEYWAKVEKDSSPFTVPSIMDGLKKAKMERVVYHKDLNTIFYQISTSHKYRRDFGDLSVIDNKMARYYCILPLHSPLTSSFSLMNIGIMENGIRHQAVLTWFKPYSIGDKGVDLMYLSIGQMSSLFLILVGAAFLSLLTLGIEFFFCK